MEDLYSEQKEKAIKEGLQIPATKVHEVRSKVKSIVLEPKLTDDQIKAREGSYFNEKDIDLLITEDTDVYGIDAQTKEKKLLAKFRKNVLPHDLVERGWEAFYIAAAASRNRGAAAGPIQLKSAYWKKRKPIKVQGWSAHYMQDGKVSKMRVNNNVFSSVLGYFEQTPFMGLPCRLTSYTQKYFKYFQHGIPFIEAIDAVFKKLVPEKHTLQYKAAHSKPSYQIADTCFSSVTINRNFRTALHMDDGDFKQGYGNLSVIERGKYHGGYTMFPRYKVGFDLRTGDFIAMDVHEWHCNSEMYETAEDKEYNKKLPKIHLDDPSTGTLGGEKSFTRISFVCYLREKIQGCDEAETKKYYKRIGLDPKKGFTKKQKGKAPTKKEKRGKTRKVERSNIED